MNLHAKHTPPAAGYTISVSKGDNWLCSATSDEEGVWRLDVPPAFYENDRPLAVLQFVSDDPEHAEASLMLIAEAIEARLYPKGDPKVREDFDRIIKVVRAVCSDKQLAVIHDALGAEKLDEATLAAIKEDFKPKANKQDHWRGSEYGVIPVENISKLD